MGCSGERGDERGRRARLRGTQESPRGVKVGFHPWYFCSKCWGRGGDKGEDQTSFNSGIFQKKGRAPTPAPVPQRCRKAREPQAAPRGWDV